jgi:hypothetical protein
VALLLALTIAGCATRKPEAIPSPPPPPTAKAPAAKAPRRVAPSVQDAKPAAKPPDVEEPLLLSPEMAQHRQDKIENDVTAMIEHTEQLVARVHLSRLTSQQTETFSTIQSFISKAKEALQQKDMPRALNLAEKAEALAQDLPASHQ